MRRGRTLCALVAVLVVLAGCGGSSGDESASTSRTSARPVSTGEANRLAVSRFLLYQGTGVRVTARFAAQQTPLTLTADVDVRRHAGYGLISGAGSAFVVAWDFRRFLTWPDRTAGPMATAPATPPTAAPTSRALDAKRTVTDALLQLLLNLGSDRPDNAQLLRQGGAQWQRSTTVGGRKVDVITGPRSTASGSNGSVLTYFVDARGNLLRVQARFGGAPSVTTIELSPSSYRPVPRSLSLGG